jgi:hypothetical protein
MAKARASGSDAVHLLAKETTYGVPPAPGAGVYRRLPLRSLSLGEEQALEDDPVWNRSNPDDSDPSLGASTVTGDLVAPMDSRGIGFILTMALGAPVSVDNGDDTFTHTWKSGKDLPSYVAQIGHPKLTVPKFRSQTGIKAGGLQFPMARNGRALVTVPLIAQKEAKDVATRDAAPLSYAYQPFDNATGGITVDGDAIANITGAQFNYSNGLEPVETIRADMAIDGVDENLRTCNGTANLRFGSDSTIDDLADSKTPAAVEYSFTLQALPDWSLKYQLPRVFFPRAKKPIEGPGGISITSNWRAAFDPTAGYMLAVVLVNDVASY